MKQGERQRNSKNENDFEEMHMAWMWEELHERFGFPLKEWKKKFATYLEKQPREIDIVSAFLRFGSDNIEPILNQILCRPGRATWNDMCDYIVKKKR